MTFRWIRLGAAIAIISGIGAATAVKAGPSMSSAWLHITVDQDTCVSRAKAAVRNVNFNTRFEVLSNSSIYGERGDYTALVRCAADREVVYFVVAGPTASVCSKHMNAMRDDF